MSEEMEIVYKELDFLNMENSLFDSYIQRIIKTTGFDLESAIMSDQSNVQAQLLTLEDKHKISIEEDKFLKIKINQERLKAERILDGKKAEIENTEVSIKRIQREAKIFEEKMIAGSEEMGGIVSCERLIGFFQYSNELNERDLHKLQEKQQSVESKLMKLQTKLSTTAQTQGTLKYIDFHQLQIENQKYQKDLNNVNDSVVELKLQMSKIMDRMNQLKINLREKMTLNEKNKSEAESRLKALENVREERKRLTQKMVDTQNILEKLQLQKSKMEDNKEIKMGIDNFIEEKNLEMKLIYEIKNLERKIDIEKGPSFFPPIKQKDRSKLLKISSNYPN